MTTSCNDGPAIFFAVARPNDERLLGRVENLVAFLAMPLVKTPTNPLVNVVQVAEDVVNRWAEVALRKGVRVVLAVETYDLMRVDATNLSRLLDTLVGNAVRFTEKGRVTVTVVRRNGWLGPGSVLIADTGVGIPAEQLAVIFESFSQGDGDTLCPYDGGGLTLPAARALAESMGCALSVDSRPGLGTRFEVEFPR